MTSVSRPVPSAQLIPQPLGDMLELTVIAAWALAAMLLKRDRITAVAAVKVIRCRIETQITLGSAAKR
jgi:hypothetical protein